MKYLIFDRAHQADNMSDFNNLNDALGLAAGYPNNGTLRYAEARLHPNGVKVAMPIMPFVEKYLTAEQLADLVDTLPADWNTETSEQ